MPSVFQKSPSVTYYHVTTTAWGVKGSLDRIPRISSTPVIVVFDIGGTFTVPSSIANTFLSSLTDVHIYGNTAPSAVVITGENSKISINGCKNTSFHHICFAVLPPHRYSNHGQPYPDTALGTYPEVDGGGNPLALPYFVNIAPTSHYSSAGLSNPHQSANSWDCMSVTSSYGTRRTENLQFHHCSFFGTTDDFDIGQGDTGPNLEPALGSKNCLYNRCIFAFTYMYRRVDVRIYTNSADGKKWGRFTEGVNYVYRDQDGHYYPSDGSPFLGTLSNVAPAGFTQTHFHLTETGHNLAALAYRANNIQYVNCLFADSNRRSPQISALTTDVIESVTGAVYGCAIKDYGTSAIAIHSKGPFVIYNNLFIPTTTGSTSRYYGVISIQPAGHPARQTYSTGTISCTGNTVTLTGGSFPSFLPGSIVDIATSVGQPSATFRSYRVKQWVSPTQLKLFKTSTTIPAGTAYTLFLPPVQVSIYACGNQELSPNPPNSVITAADARFYSSTEAHESNPYPASLVGQGVLGGTYGRAGLVSGKNLAGPTGFDISLSPLPVSGHETPPFANHLQPSPLTSDYSRDLFQNRDDEVWDRPIQTYSTGTVSSSGSTVTLSGGSFPAWIDSTSRIKVANVNYNVLSRTDSTTIVLQTSPSIPFSGASYKVYDNGWDIPALQKTYQAPVFLSMPPSSYVEMVPGYERNPANLLVPGGAGTRFCNEWELRVLNAFIGDTLGIATDPVPRGPVKSSTILTGGVDGWIDGETFSDSLPSAPLSSSIVAKVPDSRFPLATIMSSLAAR